MMRFIIVGVNVYAVLNSLFSGGSKRKGADFSSNINAIKTLEFQQNFINRSLGISLPLLS